MAHRGEPVREMYMMTGEIREPILALLKLAKDRLGADHPVTRRLGKMREDIFTVDQDLKELYESHFRSESPSKRCTCKKR